MAKSRAKSAQNASGTPKQMLHEIKNGSVKKNKNKFKSTPSAGKLALIDSKAQDKVNPQKANQNLPKENMKQLKEKQNFLKKEQDSPKMKQDSPKEKQDSPKVKQNLPKGKQDSPKGKQNSPKEKQNSPRGNQLSMKEKQNSSNKNQQVKKELDLVSKKMKVDGSNMDEEILQQDVSLKTMDGTFDEDEEGSDSDVPDIFGTSLADESDEDDEDFEDEDEEEDEEEDEDEENEDDDKEQTVKHKGVKMFEGIKSEDKDLEADDDEDDDDDDDDDDEDDEDEDGEIIQGMRCPMDTSFSGIESDEDDEDEDDDDEDDDDDDDEDEDDDDDEDEDEDEIEDENKQATLGLKALLGKTITDDEDDEDFNEEEEDDEDDEISDEDEDEDGESSKTIPKKDGEKKEKSREDQAELNKRTICVDNVPKNIKLLAIKKLFSEFGSIVKMHFRNMLPRHVKNAKKLTVANKIHPEATSVRAYILYETQESARKALSKNGQLFHENYINVKLVSEQKKHDNKKAVFLGNLKFDVQVNDVWKHFSSCGEIDSVHLFRDFGTGKPKGTAYVNFKSEDAVTLALKLDGTEILSRTVKVCSPEGKKEQRGRKRFLSSESNRPSKKFKNNSQKVVTHQAQDNVSFKKQQKPKTNMSPGTKKDSENPKKRKDNTSSGNNSFMFQGQKVTLQNKKKVNKFNKKKVMAGKLTAKLKN